MPPGSHGRMTDRAGKFTPAKSEYSQLRDYTVGQRRTACKPSAQPTQVRTLDPPPPAETASDAMTRTNTVFADEAAENLPAFDPGGDIDGVAGLAQRGFLQALVRTVAVIVPRVLGQDATEMPLTEYQHVVQALAAQCSHESFRE
jgi:hypothetical protein